MATVANLDVKIGAKTDSLKKGISNVKNQLKQLAVTVGAAFGVREIARFTSETVKLSGVAEGVAVAFERLGKPGLLDELVRATKGTVSQLDLMQQAVKASNFKIPLDTLVTGLEFATQRAKETGESVEFLARSFVTAIGRKSALVLDNLGISVLELQQEVKKVGDFATAVGNIMEREMSTWGESVDTVADKTQRLNATWRNTKVLIGDVVTETADLKDSLDGVNESLEDLNIILAAEDTKSGFNDFIDFMTTVTPLFFLAKVQINSFTKAIEEWADAIKDKSNESKNELLRNLGEIRDEFGNITGFDLIKAAKAFELLSGGGGDEEGEADKPIKTLESLRKELEDVNLLIAQTDIAKIGDIIELQNLAATIREEITAVEGLALAQAKLDDSIPDEKLAAMAALLLDVTDAAMGVNTALKDTGMVIGELASVGWQDVIEMTQLLQEAFFDMAIGLGDSIANLVLSTGGLKGVLNNLLLVLINFAKAFGAVLIAAGIAFTGSGIFAGTGIGLIAAGVGLQALGGIGAILIQRQNMNVNVTGEISGNVIKLASDRGAAFRGATT